MNIYGCNVSACRNPMVQLFFVCTFMSETVLPYCHLVAFCKKTKNMGYYTKSSTSTAIYQQPQESVIGSITFGADLIQSSMLLKIKSIYKVLLSVRLCVCKHYAKLWNQISTGWYLSVRPLERNMAKFQVGIPRIHGTKDKNSQLSWYFPFRTL